MLTTHKPTRPFVTPDTSVHEACNFLEGIGGDRLFVIDGPLVLGYVARADLERNRVRRATVADVLTARFAHCWDLSRGPGVLVEHP